MKTITWVLLLVTLYFGTGISTAADFAGQIGAQYDWWDSNANIKGGQVYAPFRFEIHHKQFSATVLGGYAYTYYTPASGSTRSLNHLLDTKVNFSYEILDRLPVDVLIGLDFNLPTGKTGHHPADLVLAMDPELVSINRFGEGYNINPTFTVAKELGKWVAGVGIGYVWRGKYDFSADIRGYEPGNILNLSAEVWYDFSPHWNFRLFSNYAYYEKDRVAQADFYQEGTFLLFGWGLGYRQTKWDAGLTLRSILRDKSKFQISGGGLSTEDKNIHGDEWLGDLSFRYFLGEKTTLKSFLQGLWIRENGYPKESSRFIGPKEKITLGVGMARTLSAFLQGELWLKGFVMHQGESRFPEFQNDRHYHGFSVGGQLTGKF